MAERRYWMMLPASRSAADTVGAARWAEEHGLEGAEREVLDGAKETIARDRPVLVLEQFAKAMGPASGPSEILTTRGRTSPFFAALINGAASHVVEQDDVHNGSVYHPATVVFPAVLAAAQEVGATGKDLIAASVARRALPPGIRKLRA